VNRWPGVSRVAGHRPVAGGGLGCLTWAGIGISKEKSGWAAMAVGPN
jgi:hypothetical protein